MADVLTIVCKHCEARYKVPSTTTNTKFQCRKCNAPIFVSTQTGQRRRPTTRRYTRVKGTPAPKKANPLHLLSAVACLGLIVAILFFVL